MNNKNVSSVISVNKSWLITYIVFSIIVQGIIAFGFVFGSFGTVFSGIGIDYFGTIKEVLESAGHADEIEIFYVIEYFSLFIGYIILTVISIVRFIGLCTSVGKSLRDGEICDDRFYSSPKHLTSAYLVMIILSSELGFYGFNEITIYTALISVIANVVMSFFSQTVMEKANVKYAVLYFFKKAIILAALFFIYKRGLSLVTFFAMVSMENYSGLYIVVESLVRPVLFVFVAIMTCKTLNETELYEEQEGVNVYKKSIITVLVCLVLLVCSYVYYRKIELADNELSFWQTVKIVFDWIKGFYFPMILLSICVAIVGSVKITGILKKSHENGIWRVKTADDEKFQFESNNTDEDEWGDDLSRVDYNEDYVDDSNGSNNSDDLNEKF